MDACGRSSRSCLIGEATSSGGDGLRRGLIASQLLGLAMMRYVWKFEPVASLTSDQVIASVAPNLQHYIDLESTVTRTPPTTKDTS